MDEQQTRLPQPQDLRPQDSHDVNNHLKANAKFVFNGPTLIVSVPVILIGGVFFFIWIKNYPSQAIGSTPWIIYITLGLAGVAAAMAVMGFSVRWVGGGVMNLYEQFADVKIKLRRHEPRPQEIEGELLEDPIPAYVEYSAIREHIPRGHTLLGIGPGGKLETRPFSVLDTMLVLGGSKTGKTNTITIKTEEGHQGGRRLLVCDPHLYKADSLYNAVRPYERDFIRPVASSQEGIIAGVETFTEEAMRRIGGGSYIEGWTIIIDEVNGLCGSPGLRSEEQDAMYRILAPLARLAGQRLRGFDMSAWFIAQSPIGLPWLMDSAMTVFCHKLLRENQMKSATNSNREVMDAMASWPRGRVFVYGLDIMGEWTLQQPHYSEIPALSRVYRPVNSVYTPETPPQADLDAPVNAFTFTEEEKLEAEKLLDTSIVGNDKRATISKLSKKMPLREVADAVNLGGRHYELFKAVCDEIGIKKGA